MGSNIPETMLAFRFKPSFTDPVEEHIPPPNIGPDEVLLQVLAGGVCHSDLAVLDPNNPINHRFTSMAKTFTMGHEGSGIIVALGSAVPGAHPELTKGTYVAVWALNACFESSCAACASGHTNLCRAKSSTGLGVDGAWAPYMAVQASCVVPIPADQQTLPPAVAAIATDAVLTPYHAMKTSVKEGDTVLCLGIGGLGLNAIPIAKNCCGASIVVACDTRESSLAQAGDVGADHTTHPDDLFQYISDKHITVDVAIDFVGIQKTWETCLAAIKHGGTVHSIGLAGPPLQISPLVTMYKEPIVRFGLWGRKDELVEVLQAILDGKIKPMVELRPLSECVQVLKEFHEGTLKNRVALVPDNLL